MTHRETILWRIAELYTDLTDPLNGPAGIRGTGSSSGLHGHESTCHLNRSDETHWTAPRCTCSKLTIDEYERLTRLMRDDRSEPLLTLEHKDRQGHVLRTEKVSVRSAWWHLEHHWHRAQRVIRHDPVTVKNGKRIAQLHNQDGSLVTKLRLDYLRHKDADEAKALLAITWIADHWGLATEPMLPKAVIEPLKTAA